MKLGMASSVELAHFWWLLLIPCWNNFRVIVRGSLNLRGSIIGNRNLNVVCPDIHSCVAFVCVYLLGRCAIYDIRPKFTLKPNLLKLRSSKTSVSVVHSFWNLHKARQYHCRALCNMSKRFGNWEVIDKRDFTRFGFKMSFGWIAYIAQHPRVVMQTLLYAYVFINWCRLWCVLLEYCSVVYACLFVYRTEAVSYWASETVDHITYCTSRWKLILLFQKQNQHGTLISLAWFFVEWYIILVQISMKSMHQTF